MRKLRRFLNFWLPPLLCMAVIFWLSSMSDPPSPKIQLKWIDKIFHFIAYAGLSFWVMRAFMSLKMSAVLPWIATILVIAIYAASDEWHQSFTENRSPEINDWIADCLGGGFGSFAMFIFDRIWSNRGVLMQLFKKFLGIGSVLIFLISATISANAADRSKLISTVLMVSGIGLKFTSVSFQKTAQQNYDDYLHTANQKTMQQFKDDYIKNRNASQILSHSAYGMIGLSALIAILDQADLIGKSENLNAFKIESRKDSMTIAFRRSF